MRRARQLAVALQKLGLERGDRVATLCWNHYQHHEAYFGIPCGGFVLHTLNLRLHPNDLAYIATHADDRAVIVDRSLLPLLEQFSERTHDRARLRRRGLLRGAARDGVAGRVARPRARRERGRGDVLHERHDRPAEGRRLLAPLHRAARARRRREQPARPGRRHRTTRSCRSCRCSTRTRGAIRTSRRCRARSSSTPGPHLDPESLLDDMVQEKVTWAAGVPTIWMGILAAARRRTRQVGSLAHEGDARRRLRGAARDDRGVRGASRADDRPGLGHDRDVAGRVDGCAPARPRGGRRRDALGLPGDGRHAARRSSRSARASATRSVPWDGESMGELEVRGPWVAAALLRHARAAPTAGPTTAGSRPATSSRSTRAASSRSRTARRT